MKCFRPDKAKIRGFLLYSFGFLKQIAVKGQSPRSISGVACAATGAGC